MKNFEINYEAYEGYKELFMKTGNPIFLCVSSFCKEQLKKQENLKEDDTSLSL